MFCPKCGANMRDGQYCPVCGYFASGQAPSGNYYGSANNKAAVSPKNSRNKILPLLAISDCCSFGSSDFGSEYDEQWNARN